jgi:hypothetical protein
MEDLRDENVDLRSRLARRINPFGRNLVVVTRKGGAMDMLKAGQLSRESFLGDAVFNDATNRHATILKAKGMSQSWLWEPSERERGAAHRLTPHAKLRPSGVTALPDAPPLSFFGARFVRVLPLRPRIVISKTCSRLHNGNKIGAQILISKDDFAITEWRAKRRRARLL